MKRTCLKQEILLIIIILIQTFVLTKCDTEAPNGLLADDQTNRNNLDIHTAVHYFVEAAKNFKNFLSFEFDSLKLKKKYLLKFQDKFVFNNITEECSIQMNSFIDGLKREDDWAVTG